MRLRRRRLSTTVAFAALTASLSALTGSLAAKAESAIERFEVQPSRGSFTTVRQAPAPRATVPAGAAGAPAAQPAAAADISPPELPPVVVRIDGAPVLAPAPAVPAVDIPAPDLPPVIVRVEPAPAPTVAATAPKIDASPKSDISASIHIPPPDLPEARVVVEGASPSDAIASSVASQPAPSVIATTPAAELSAAIKARVEKDGWTQHPRLTRAVRDEIAALYAQRGHAPLWVGAAGATAAGRALISQLRRAEEDGLDSASYAVAGVDAPASDAATLAALDLNMSVAAVMYARDARGGRIDARRLSNLIDPTISAPSAEDALHAIASAPDAGAALQAFNPPHEGYRALREKLRETREGAERVASVAIPQGPILRVGMTDARVALVRERLKLAPADDTTYDASVADAVSSFQRARGLTANGQLTRQTVAALSGPSAPRLESDIVANMERWRWLPRELGQRHIMVNIPDYQVRVMNGAVVEHQARVIVGKPDTPTPIFSDVMQFLVVNPSWYVPPSILKKEFLPKLASDPTYAERRGYQVIRRGSQISVRQPPGERNALGNVKFMFPNRHAVYLHDTPTRHLFSADRRAFSHGCVRVDQPFRLAEILLGKERGWSEGRVRGLVGRGEQSVKMEDKLPIHLVYFTTYVDELGRLQHRDDLYGHDRRVRAALGLDG